MGTTFPTAVDRLFARAETSVLAANSQASVTDGFPDKKALDQFVVGADPQRDGTEGEQANVSIGQGKIDEEYDVSVSIKSIRGGTSQKQARDAAFVMYDAFLAALRADRDLAGLLRPFVMEIRNLSYLPTTDPEEAAEMRTFSIFFDVHCKARI